MSDDILARLKAATAASHERVEGQVRFLSDDAPVSEYAAYLAKLLGFHVPLERALAASLSHPLLGGREKAPLLTEDLRRLSCDPAQVPVCPFTPSVGSVSRALGCSYVLEGATLGGKHVLERMAHRIPNGASAYLACYGPEVGGRWKVFRHVVRSQIQTPADADACIAAAVETFDALSRWLQS